MEILFKTGATASLTEVERDDEHFVIGKTDSGKRLVVPRENLVERAEGETPNRHPYRVYTTDGGMLRVTDPAFEEVENFFLATDADPLAKISLRLDSDVIYPMQRGRMLSILSAMPEDEPNEAGTPSEGASDPEPVAT